MANKFVAKLLKYIILFKDIPTLLVHDNRDASLITFVVLEICLEILPYYLRNEQPKLELDTYIHASSYFTYSSTGSTMH